MKFAAVAAATLAFAAAVEANKSSGGDGSTPAPVTTKYEQGNVPQIITYALEHLNNIRASKGLQPLCINKALQASAQDQSNWMASVGKLDHRPDTFERFDGYGYAQNVPRAENIAVNQIGVSKGGCFGQYNSIAVKDDTTSAAYTTDCAWYQSPGHYKNMMTPGFNQVGIAYTKGNWMGSPSYYWTQNFGTSAQPCVSNDYKPAPAPAPKPEEPKPKPYVPAPAPAPKPKPEEPKPKPYVPAPAEEPKPKPYVPKPAEEPKPEPKKTYSPAPTPAKTEEPPKKTYPVVTPTPTPAKTATEIPKETYPAKKTTTEEPKKTYPVVVPTPVKTATEVPTATYPVKTATEVPTATYPVDTPKKTVKKCKKWIKGGKKTPVATTPAGYGKDAEVPTATTPAGYGKDDEVPTATTPAGYGKDAEVPTATTPAGDYSYGKGAEVPAVVPTTPAGYGKDTPKPAETTPAGYAKDTPAPVATPSTPAGDYSYGKGAEVPAVVPTTPAGYGKDAEVPTATTPAGYGKDAEVPTATTPAGGDYSYGNGAEVPAATTPAGEYVAPTTEEYSYGAAPAPVPAPAPVKPAYGRKAVETPKAEAVPAYTGESFY
ncbi:hypothetical protein H9P43_004922 [Blastocladiella emersonii ATCC 22665]|nr:hypothetical protein H9P43_004922 [Blastocladiella emersonii ATCC 22665]